MKITRIETLTGPHQAVVRVYTDDGLEGIGQTSPRQEDVTTKVLHNLIAPIFLGQDPWDLPVLVRRCYREKYKFAGTFMNRAVCGVEAAVWDLLGKATNKPVYKIFGGEARSEIPVYASSMSRKITPEEEAQRMVDLVDRDGFRCVKFKIGGRMSQDADAWPGRTDQIIPLMREALGPEIDINVDANSSYSAHKAIKIGRLLEKYNYHHFEEPCPFFELENTKIVADALDIPVAGGEQDQNLHLLKRMIDERIVDIIQFDIGYIGGLLRAKQIADLAELAGMPCTPHSANLTMIGLFSMHFAAAMPACYQYQEWRIEKNMPGAEEIYEPMLEVHDGKIKLSDRSGWGITLQSGYLKKAEVYASTV